MNSRSFSLIEVVFVLTISGILISFGMKGCFNVLESKRIEKTEAVLNSYKLLLLKAICKGERQIPDPPTDAWGRKVVLCLSDGKAFSCTKGILNFNPCRIGYAETYVKGRKVEKNVVAVVISSGSNLKLDSRITKEGIEIKGDDVWDALSLYRVKDECCPQGNMNLISREIPPIVEGETYDFALIVEGGVKPFKCKFNPTPKGLKVQTESDGYCHIVYSGGKLGWSIYNGYVELEDATGLRKKFKIALSVIREKP